MTAKQIFSKTMPYNFAKLILGLATVVASVILFAILMGISWLFNSEGVTGIMFLIWISATGVIRFLLMHYLGYMVKAGHIAVITMAVTEGKIPPNQVEYGKKMVKERFAQANVYFAVDKLVSGAVKQLQNALQRVGNALGFVPGMDAVVGVGKFFIEISLGYIDECCLGYTFYKKEQGAFKSATDGVVIFAQNWKVLLKNAAKTMVAVIVGMIVIILALFVVLGLLFRLLNWSGFIAFLIACFIAWTIKFAFIDSYILVRTMCSYMQVAPSTVITFDLYSQLCSLSAKFKELFNKGQQEKSGANPMQAQTVNGNPVPVQAVNGSAPSGQSGQIFCGQCGTKNDVGTKFCGSCGAKL